jgi:hypothetical protein
VKRPKAKWARRHAFAEAAEALGIRTDQVAALHNDGRMIGVLWSTDDAPDDGQYTAFFRGSDGILFQYGDTRTLPGYFRELFRRLGE